MVWHPWGELSEQELGEQQCGDSDYHGSSIGLGSGPGDSAGEKIS